MSKLLMDDKPVMVLPKLAEAIGLNEAIVIQQIHYWLITFQEANKEEHFRDGRWWIYNSKKEWKDNFPWWSENTIWRSLIALREMGLVITSDEYNKKEYDKTLWYSIDYEKLNEIVEELITKMGTTRYQNGNDLLPKWERPVTKMGTTIPEINTEITYKDKATAVNAEPNENLETAKVFKAYEQEIGMITAFTREEVLDAIEHYPHDWIIEAIKEAAKNNVRKWSYARAILESWKVNGYKTDVRPKEKVSSNSKKVKHEDNEERVNNFRKLYKERNNVPQN